MERWHDDEFGLIMAANGNGVLAQRVMLGGRPIAVAVELDEHQQMEPQQRQAIRHALALGADALEHAAPAVAQNYAVYREAIADDAQMAPLRKPVDVWQQVQIERIVVPRHHAAGHAYFLIHAACEWDPEHGLEVRFRDGVAIEADQVGSSGGAYDDTPEHVAMLRQAIADASATYEP